MGWLGAILWVVVIAALVLILAIAKRVAGDGRGNGASDPLAILEERLALVEIDLRAYEARRDAVER